MKKSIIALLLLLSVILTACQSGGNTPENTDGETSVTTTASDVGGIPSPIDTMSLAEIAGAIYKGVDAEFPSLVERIPDLSDKEMFVYDFGIEPDSTIKEGYISEPVIGSMPYMMGLLRVDSAASAAKLAKSVKDNVNPGKWICVIATSVETASKGSVVLLIMDNDASRAASVVKAFSEIG